MRLCIGYAGSRHSSAVHKRCIGSAFRRRVEWEQGALRAFDTAVEGTGFEEIGALATVNSITFPRSRLLDRSDSPDSRYLQVRDDINTSAFCRTCIGDGNLSEVRTGIWPDGRCLHRCAASKIANAALCGSAITAMRPISSIFMGGM